MSVSVAVLGASGYAGGELIRLLDGHPEFEVVYLGAHTKAGERLAAVHPHLGGGERLLESLDPAGVPPVDFVFFALPHGASAEPAMELAGRGAKLVDLGSDFRFDSVERYRDAYGSEHPFPDQLRAWAYGLPELFGSRIASSDRVAVPGCYPTSVILAVAPLLGAGVIEGSQIIVDSVSGASGAGREPKAQLTFGAVDEGVVAYGVLTHRHRPEMEQGLAMATGIEPVVLFTPHLVPMQRGILSTCYATAVTGATVESLRHELSSAYASCPFVSVIDGPPQTRWVVGSNRCLISVFLDERTDTAVVMSAEDNLLKGAAGQAVQCANLMAGFDETAGLSTVGWMP